MKLDPKPTPAKKVTVPASEKTAHRSPTKLVALSRLMGDLYRRDPLTARHCGTVARHAHAIAEELGLSQAECELVHLAGLTHDVGKIFLPDRILTGNEPLDDRDWALVKRHPEQGAWLIAEVHPGPLAEIVLDHHERIDGSGYPNGLTGPEISLHARIISVADTYDAMTSRESYRSAISTEEAIAELRRVAGTQLDALVVEALVSVIARGTLR